MKRISRIFYFALLLLVGTEFSQNSAQCQSVTVTPSTLTFTDITVSPSAAQTITITNGTGDAVYISASPHTQIHMDGFGWQGYGEGCFGSTHSSFTVSVRISTDTHVDNLNESLPIYAGICGYISPTASVLINGSAPLPIQLASFKAATLSGNGVSLTWTTFSETNNYGFYVQRNGVDLKFIAGHGTTLDQHSYSYTDNPVPGQYKYGLKQVDLDGTAALSETILMDVAAPVPTKFVLNQNYPNPFNPSTQIAFSITKESPVSLRVYDVLGREVATLVNENRKPGQYTERFDGTRLASGVYMYVLQTAEGRLTSRMILSK
jgi:hypothetical protein